MLNVPSTIQPQKRNLSEIVTPRRPLHTGTYNQHNVSQFPAGTKRTKEASDGNSNSLLNKEDFPPLKRRAMHSTNSDVATYKKQPPSALSSLSRELSENTTLLKGLFGSQLVASVAGQSTTAASTTASEETLNRVLGFEQAVFGQAVKESTECLAFLNVAFNDALTEAQQTLKNKAVIGGVAAATFLASWVGVAGIVSGILGSQLSGSNSELLIKSIEGATKLWAAYKLHQLIKLGEEFKQRADAQPDAENGADEVIAQDPGAVAQAEVIEIPSSSHTIQENDKSQSPLEEKYKTRFQSKSEDLYGNLNNIIKYVAVQTAREGGELGVLSGVTLTPYITAGANIGIGAGSIALSGLSGIAAPFATYHVAKGAVGLTALLEKKFNQTDWIARKCDGFIGASGDWIKNMLVMTLLSVGVHEIEEVLRIDVKLWDLKTTSPLLSEKLAPLAVVAALLPYDADPTFWQATVMFYAWAKYAVIPTTKFAYTKFSEFYSHCKSKPNEEHTLPDVQTPPVSNVDLTYANQHV